MSGSFISLQSRWHHCTCSHQIYPDFKLYQKHGVLTLCLVFPAMCRDSAVSESGHFSGQKAQEFLADHLSSLPCSPLRFVLDCSRKQYSPSWTWFGCVGPENCLVQHADAAGWADHEHLTQSMSATDGSGSLNWIWESCSLDALSKRLTGWDPEGKASFHLILALVFWALKHLCVSGEGQCWKETFSFAGRCPNKAKEPVCS